MSRGQNEYKSETSAANPSRRFNHGIHEKSDAVSIELYQ